jgi:multidrug efflux system outer membrane protein
MTRFEMKNVSRSLALTFAIAAAAVFIAGCNIGPRYKRPEYAAPASFRGADNTPVVSSTQNSLGDEKWAEVFREPELKALIETALVNNYDVRIAAQRVRRNFRRSPAAARLLAPRCLPLPG